MAEPLVCEPVVEVTVENFVPTDETPEAYSPGRSNRSGRSGKPEKAAKWTQQRGVGDKVTTTVVFVVEEVDGVETCVVADEQPEPVRESGVEVVQYTNPGGKAVYKF